MNAIDPEIRTVMSAMGRRARTAADVLAEPADGLWTGLTEGAGAGRVRWVGWRGKA